MCPRIRHRLFTKWIEQHAPQWLQLGYVENRYPCDPKRVYDTSFADFYFFYAEALSQALHRMAVNICNDNRRAFRARLLPSAAAVVALSAMALPSARATQWYAVYNDTTTIRANLHVDRKRSNL